MSESYPLFVRVPSPDPEGGYDIWALDEYAMPARNWLQLVKDAAPEKPIALPLPLPVPGCHTSTDGKPRER